MKKYSIAELLEMDLAGLPKTKMGSTEETNGVLLALSQIAGKSTASTSASPKA